jgi:hypothetical protein
MSAEGKINTASLSKGDRIMVIPMTGGVEGDVRPSPTKKKDAVVMAVYNVEPTRSSGVRGRLTYHIHGVLEGGDKVRVPHASGNQTFWLAKA